ncbi:glycosyltransferase family 87 protein [Pontibacter toksunensis]|uniref:Glycosyltransferase family 87 protein n=1 Tax=Pontibacter toksunensis TaxID=1332631 RepID=A0ABW6BY75_9BACT
MNKLLHSKYTWVFFLGSISFVLLTGEVINERLRMHDLEVYYRTAARLMQGEALYRIATDGHYVYKYSPTAAIYFIPFLLLPFSVAKVLYWVLLTFLTGVAFQLFYRMLLPQDGLASDNRKQNIVLLLSFLAVAVHLHREWHLGQVNLLLLGLYIFMMKGLVHGKPVVAGLLLAASLFIKPFGLIFFPYLLLKQRYRTIFYAVGFILLLGLLPMLFYPSLPAFKHLYLSWFQELTIELKAKQRLLTEGNHTIFSVLARYTPVQYALTSAAAIKVYQFVLLVLIGGLFLLFNRWGRQLREQQVPELAFLIALVPLFAFTSENAFLFTAPCIMYLVYNYQNFSLAGKAALILACFLIGATIRDVTGAAVYGYLQALSVYSVGTVLLLVLMFALQYKKKGKTLDNNPRKGEEIRA